MLPRSHLPLPIQIRWWNFLFYLHPFTYLPSKFTTDLRGDSSPIFHLPGQPSQGCKEWDPYKGSQCQNPRSERRAEDDSVAEGMKRAGGRVYRRAKSERSHRQERMGSVWLRRFILKKIILYQEEERMRAKAKGFLKEKRQKKLS